MVTPLKAGIAEYAELPVRGAQIGVTAGIPELLTNVQSGITKSIGVSEAALEAALTSLGPEEDFTSNFQDNAFRNHQILKALEQAAESNVIPASNLFRQDAVDYMGPANQELFANRPDLEAAIQQGGMPAELAFGLSEGLGKYLPTVPLGAASGAGLFATMGTEALVGGATGLTEGLAKNLNLADIGGFKAAPVAAETAYGAAGGATGGAIGKGLQVAGKAISAAKPVTAAKEYLGKLGEMVQQRKTMSQQARMQAVRNINAGAANRATRQMPGKPEVQAEVPAQAVEPQVPAGPARPITERDVQILKARQKNIEGRQQTKTEAQEALESRKKTLEDLENKPATVEDAKAAAETMGRLDETNKQTRQVQDQVKENQKKIDSVNKTIDGIKEKVKTRKVEAKEARARKAELRKELERLKGIKSKRNAKQRPKQIEAIEKEIADIDKKLKRDKDFFARQDEQIAEWDKDLTVLENIDAQLNQTARELNVKYQNDLNNLDQALGIRQKEAAIQQTKSDIDTLDSYIKQADDLPMSEYEKDLIGRVRELAETSPKEYEQIVESVLADSRLRKEQAAANIKPEPAQKEVQQAKQYQTSTPRSLSRKTKDAWQTITRHATDGVNFLRKIGAKEAAQDLNEFTNAPQLVKSQFYDRIQSLAGLSKKRFEQVLKSINELDLANGKWDNFSPVQLKVARAVESALGEIYDTLKAAGIELPEKIQNYFPRHVKSFKDFLDELLKNGDVDIQERARLEKEYFDAFESTLDTEDAIIDKLTKKRVTETITPERKSLYLSPLQSLDKTLSELGRQYGFTKLFKGLDLNSKAKLSELIPAKVNLDIHNGKYDVLTGYQVLKTLNQTLAPNQYSAVMATARNVFDMLTLKGLRSAAIQFTTIPRNMSRFGVSEATAALFGKKKLDVKNLERSILNDVETNEGKLRAIRDVVLVGFDLANKFEANMTLNTAYNWVTRNAKLKLSKGKGTPNFERFLENWVDPADQARILKKLADGGELDGDILNTALSAARNVGGLVMGKGDKPALANTAGGKLAYSLRGFQIKNANINLDRTIGELSKDPANAFANTARYIAGDLAPVALMNLYFANLAGGVAMRGANYVNELKEALAENTIPLFNKYQTEQLAEGRKLESLALDTIRPGASSALRIAGGVIQHFREGGDLTNIADPETSKVAKDIPGYIPEIAYLNSQQKKYDVAEKIKGRSYVAEELSNLRGAEAMGKVQIDARLKDNLAAKRELERRKTIKTVAKKYRTLDPTEGARYKVREDAYEMLVRKGEYKIGKLVADGKLTQAQAAVIMEKYKREYIPQRLQRDYEAGKFD